MQQGGETKTTSFYEQGRRENFSDVKVNEDPGSIRASDDNTVTERLQYCTAAASVKVIYQM